MLTLKFADNESLWAIEREAKKHGYKMDHNAYWVQIFTNADWDQITTERDEEYKGDALEILREYFGEVTEASQPENEKIKKTVEVKNGRKWEHSFTDHVEENVYKSLANDLIAKKINGCSYIRSIKRTPLYNGYQKIVVMHDNGVRTTYIVEEH